jgi:hypothetical protein
MVKGLSLCACGERISPTKMEQHRASKWHKIAREARILRAAGCSFSEIARQTGVSKQYVYLKLGVR